MIVNLPNTGLLIKRLPEELFNNLKQQVIKDSLKPMFSGVSNADNVAKHYYLEDPIPLKQYVLSIIGEYFKEYDTAMDYLVKSNHEGSNAQASFHALEPWCNRQTKNQWIPAHSHCGILSYALWINVPEDNVFEFIYSGISGETMKYFVPVNKQSEGTIMVFPSKLMHTVTPFFNSDETRIAISGNIALKWKNEQGQLI